MENYFKFNWYNEANIWYENVEYFIIPLHKLSNTGSQGIVAMDDGTFLLTGNRSDITNQILLLAQIVQEMYMQ